MFDHEAPLSLLNQPYQLVYRQLRTLQSGKVDKYGSANIAVSEDGSVGFPPTNRNWALLSFDEVLAIGAEAAVSRLAAAGHEGLLLFLHLGR